MTREEKIELGLVGHYSDALKHFDESHIVFLGLQGSQNYGLDYEESDIDTKLIVVPTFKDIALARKPVSTTFVRENNEHLDEKDIRLYIETFRKQNLNFLEILFTPYHYITPLYREEWMRLVDAREGIAHMNPWRAVKSMKGIALEKYHAMEHDYPSRRHVLAKYSYDIKQLHHLVRIDYFLTQYIAGKSYEETMIPEEKMKAFLMDIKRGKWELAAARELADQSLAHINKISDEFFAKTEDKEDPAMRELLEDVSYNIMKIAVEEELKYE